MPLNDNAILIVGSGNYFTAPYAATPAELPANLKVAPTTPWVNAGHTPLDEILSLTSEGGEGTDIGTLQNKTLRTRYSTRTERINFSLHQFDQPSLKLYYGSNAMYDATSKMFRPHIEPTPTVASFLAIFLDGENVFAIHAPKAEIYRREDISISDTENLAELPLSVKPLVHGTNKWTYQITPLGEV